MMQLDDRFRAGEEAEEFERVVHLLRSGREEVLHDWLARVRDNRAVEAGQGLSDPLLLDHVPQLFDAMVDRLAAYRSREDAEQLAAIHGFSRRITGYDIVETVVELLMFRRSIWALLGAGEAPLSAAMLAMERIDGMLDRALLTSLQAFLDPAARMFVRRTAEAAAVSAADTFALPPEAGKAPVS